MNQQIYVRSQLNRILYDLVGSWELVDVWWYSSNKALAGMAPNDVYWSGEEGRRQVADYILKHANGVY